MILNNKLIGCDKNHEWIKKNEDPHIQKIISKVTYGYDISQLDRGILAAVDIYLSDTIKIKKSNHITNHPLEIIKFIIKSFEEVLEVLQNRENIKKLPEFE